MITVGIDEVGRGCLAGPLVAGAVILPRPIEGLRDSKVLSRIQREALAKLIHTEAVALGLGWVSPREIDKLGLTKAVRLAMRRALAQIEAEFDEIIIDGNYNFLAQVRGVPGGKIRTIIKADATVPVVSAASIVAKVARDDWMIARAARDFPHYGFENHVGYATKQHLEALRIHGNCHLHRKSFSPIAAMEMESVS